MFEVQETHVRGERVFMAYFRDELTPGPVLAFVDAMTECEARHPSHKLLVDFTAVKKVSIDYKELRSIVQYVKDNDKRKGKAAFVVGKNIGRFVFANLYVAMTNLFAPGQDKAFLCTRQAIDWLCPETARPFSKVTIAR